MSKPKRFYVIENEDDDTLVYPEDLLHRAGLSDDAAIETAFNNAGKWVEVWLKKALGSHEIEIKQLCQVENAQKALVYDENLVLDARIAVMVEKWNGISHKPNTLEARGLLELPLANAIDAIVLARLYPSALRDPRFLSAWKQAQEQLEAKPQ